MEDRDVSRLASEMKGCLPTKLSWSAAPESESAWCHEQLEAAHGREK
jgi:hypothetical protein